MSDGRHMITKFRQGRIKILTDKGYSSSIIAERLGMQRGTVYEVQVRLGLRKPASRAKGGD